MRDLDEMQKELDRQAKRLDKAEKERPTLFAQTVFLGTLGLVFVLPVIGGAYLGEWIDSLASGYSVRWTVSLILVGVFVGGVNAYLLLREP